MLPVGKGPANGACEGMSMKRRWIGNHLIRFSRETMIGMGFDVSAWPCVDDDGKRVRSWQARAWFACWILSVTFNAGSK